MSKLKTYLLKAIHHGISLRVQTPQKGDLGMVRPLRLAELEGEQCLIFEASGPRHLSHVSLKEISKLSFGKSQKSNSSPFLPMDLDQYQKGIQRIEGHEVRLVIKILSGKEDWSVPQDLSVGNPFMVATPQGEWIWAGWVERTPQLFDWLTPWIEKIQILDPSDFGEELLSNL